MLEFAVIGKGIMCISCARPSQTYQLDDQVDKRAKAEEGKGKDHHKIKSTS
jgi:hypothetical protein